MWLPDCHTKRVGNGIAQVHIQQADPGGGTERKAVPIVSSSFPWSSLLSGFCEVPRKHGPVPSFRLPIGRHRIEQGRRHLAGSVGGTCDSRSQSCKFEPLIGYREFLKIKSFGEPGWHSS